MARDKFGSPFLTVAEAARYLKVSEPTVWRWIRGGRLTSFKVGRVRRIPLSALDELVGQGTRASEPRVRPFSLDDPLWALAGAGRSGCRDVSRDKYRYLSGGAHRS
jgi:excisionase family DNA binding protein